MPYMVIAGIPFRVSDGGATKRPEIMGDLEISRRGAPQDSRRDERETWDLVLRTLSHDEVNEAIDIVDMRAHVWSFDKGLESAGGLGPFVDYGDGTRLRPVGGAYGGALEVAADESIRFDTQLGEDWTVLARIREAGGSDLWRMYALDSEGNEWRDGVAGTYGVDDAIAVVSGDLTLRGEELGGGGTGAALLFDEVGVFYRELRFATAVMLTSLDEPLSPLPYALKVYGDAVAEPLGFLAKGESRDAPFTPSGGIETGWSNNSLAQRFSLREEAWRTEVAEAPIPVGYWTFDTDLVSSSAPEALEPVNGLDATLGGAATVGTATGRNGVGQAYEGAGGGSDFATVPHNALLEITGDLTIAAWVFVDAFGLNGRGIASKGTPSGPAFSDAAYIFNVQATGELRLFHQDGALIGGESFLSTEIVPGSEWTWVAVTRRAGEIEFWINGRREITGAQTAAQTPGGPADTLRIGQTHELLNKAFDGRIDELAIWSSALNPRQILGAYLATERAARYRHTG